jgi:benzoyl-CoA reductase subunit C
MSISALTEILKAGIDDPTFPEVTVWKNSHPGGKAVGCLPIYTPTEMIHAAGMLPVFLSGAMGHLKLDSADSYIQSFACSIARSTFELYLDGYLKNIDALVFSSVCEVLRGLSGIWKRVDPHIPIIFLNYPQNFNSDSALDFMISELGRFKTGLEKISGSKITDDALFKSFELFNRRAELLNKLDLYRSKFPEKFRTSEFYILRLAGRAIPIEEHIELLEEALKALEQTEPRNKAPKARIVLFGAFCERPPVAMIEAMEEERIAIVHDDLVPGLQWYNEPLPLTGDPLKILASLYLKSNVHTPVVSHPESSIGDAILGIVRERSADGLLLATAKSCHPMLHDLHNIYTASEKHGIPYVRIEFEEDQQVFESIIVQIEAIIEARELMPLAGTDLKEGSND